jgi:hypothetical protein
MTWVEKIEAAVGENDATATAVCAAEPSNYFFSAENARMQLRLPQRYCAFAQHMRKLLFYHAR